MSLDSGAIDVQDHCHLAIVLSLQACRQDRNVMELKEHRAWDPALVIWTMQV